MWYFFGSRNIVVLTVFQQNKIKDLLMDSDCHTISGIEKNYIDRMGRLYGGCAIIWNKNLYQCE